MLRASDDRVEPPCPWARPGRCGGCDLQHASLAAQRRLKADVVREQLQRLAGIEQDVTVEAVPGDEDGLGWRTRVRFAVGEDGRAGLRAHRSHRVVPVDRCRIAHDLVSGAGVLVGRWPPDSTVEVAASVATGEVVVLPEGAVGRRTGDGTLTERVGARAFRVSAGGFWQVHPGAASTLLSAVLDGLDPRAGESVLDLYSGVGLFAASLAERVGETGRVTAVESDRGAVADARHNLAGLPQVRVDAGRVDHVLRRPHLRHADLVVLDPPRSGAGKAVVRLLSRVGARRIAYVACDPAALARDLKWFAEGGYAVESLRAYDLFPMTHHVECVAVLAPRSR